MSSAPLSPTGKAALAQLEANRVAGRRTHVSAVHPAARDALIARGLIEYVDGTARTNLRITEAGTAAA